MDNTRPPKHALNYKPRGRKDRGRPRKRGKASMPEQRKRPNPWRKMIVCLLVWRCVSWRKLILLLTVTKQFISHYYTELFSPPLFVTLSWLSDRITGGLCKETRFTELALTTEHHTCKPRKAHIRQDIQWEPLCSRQLIHVQNDWYLPRGSTSPRNVKTN
jgi:hypothetical protein